MMMYQGLKMDIFINELKRLINSVVVKRDVIADKNETVESLQDGEMFVLAKSGLAEFSSFTKFHYESYKQIESITESDIILYNKSKENIPGHLRSRIVDEECKYIIRNYQEKNNYYRMLAGLPDLEDTEVIYVPENSLGIDTTIAIHRLDLLSLNKLETSGMMDEIKLQYPDKKYLYFLGTKSIDYYTARNAANYELLYLPVTDPANIANDFKKFYSNARDYYMIGVYNNDISRSYDYYDNFIGLCIILMAIQRTISNIFRTGITREFYDIQIVRYLFDSYSIPYIERMNIEQLKLLAKNLNIFLAFKSSDRVLFDICAVFGFSNVNIYKYLLVKNHLQDSVTFKPIFPTKTVVYSDGTIEENIPDYDRQFELYFQRVNIKSKDINTALIDQTNKFDYKDLTTGDIYWVDSEELRNKIYETNLNYIESKYISLEVMFKLTETMYEVCHVFRMVIDNNKEFKKPKLYLPRIDNREHDLYSVIIFLCAFFCKKYNFTGEIPLKPAAVASVYGFNFDTDLNLIRQNIYQSKYLDNSMIQYLLNFSVNRNKPEKDVERIYRNIKNLKDFVVEQMANTKDIDVYRAYKKFYNSILVIEDKNDKYQKNDGTYAETYFDLLADIDPSLSFFIENFDYTNDVLWKDTMRHVLLLIEDLSNDFKHLHDSIDTSILFNILIKLIEFFKSYTVDLIHSGILYVLDDRYFNMLKILDRLEGVKITWWLYDGLKDTLYDLISKYKINANISDIIKLINQIYSSVFSTISTKLNMSSKVFPEIINYIKEKLTVFDFLFADVKITSEEKNIFYDKIIESMVSLYGYELMILNTEVMKEVNFSLVSRISHKTKGRIYDVITYIRPLEPDILTIRDIIVSVTVSYYLQELLIKKERNDIEVINYQLEKIIKKESNSSEIKSDQVDLLLLQTLMNNLSEFYITKNLNLKEALSENLDVLQNDFVLSNLDKNKSSIYILKMIKLFSEVSSKLNIYTKNDEFLNGIYFDFLNNIKDKIRLYMEKNIDNKIPLKEYVSSIITEIRLDILKNYSTIYYNTFYSFKALFKLDEDVLTRLNKSCVDYINRLTDGIKFIYTDYTLSENIIKKERIISYIKTSYIDFLYRIYDTCYNIIHYNLDAVHLLKDINCEINSEPFLNNILLLDDLNTIKHYKEYILEDRFFIKEIFMLNIFFEVNDFNIITDDNIKIIKSNYEKTKMKISDKLKITRQLF